jgi:hypothetical protein
MSNTPVSSEGAGVEAQLLFAGVDELAALPPAEHIEDVLSDLSLDEPTLHSIFVGYVDALPDQVLAAQVIDQAAHDRKFLDTAYRAVMDAMVLSSAATFFVDDLDFEAALESVGRIDDDLLVRMRSDLFGAGLRANLKSEDAAIDPTLPGVLARRGERARVALA